MGIWFTPEWVMRPGPGGEPAPADRLDWHSDCREPNTINYKPLLRFVQRREVFERSLDGFVIGFFLALPVCIEFKSN